VSFGQLYRDRGDSENIFDELKKPMGLGRLSFTQDLARCRLAARMIALFYDWWSIFVRLVEPDRHMEAITSRPLLLHAIARRVRHARQTTITVASFTREGRFRPRRRFALSPFFARTHKKCGAVDGPATLAANPRESLPSFPSGPSVALTATPRAQLMQPLVETAKKSTAYPMPTAVFRIIRQSHHRTTLRRVLFLALRTWSGSTKNSPNGPTLVATLNDGLCGPRSADAARTQFSRQTRRGGRQADLTEQARLANHPSGRRSEAAPCLVVHRLE